MMTQRYGNFLERGILWCGQGELSILGTLWFLFSYWRQPSHQRTGRNIKNAETRNLLALEISPACDQIFWSFLNFNSGIQAGISVFNFNGLYCHVQLREISKASIPTPSYYHLESLVDQDQVSFNACSTKKTPKYFCVCAWRKSKLWDWHFLLFLCLFFVLCTHYGFLFFLKR